MMLSPIGNVRIARLGGNYGIFAPTHGKCRREGSVGPAGDGDRLVVLLPSENPIREPGIRRHLVELPGGLVILARPGSSTIDGHRSAVIGADDHAPGVCRIDPQVVAVSWVKLEHGAAAVGAPPQTNFRNVDGVGILRVRYDG